MTSGWINIIGGIELQQCTEVLNIIKKESPLKRHRNEKNTRDNESTTYRNINGLVSVL